MLRPGFLLYITDDGLLVAQHFDPDEATLEGEAYALRESPRPAWRRRKRAFSASGNASSSTHAMIRSTLLSDGSSGMTARVSRSDHSGAPACTTVRKSLQMTRVSRSGGATPQATITWPWISGFETCATTRRQRMTSGGGRWPVWSTDGTEVIYQQSRNATAPGLHQSGARRWGRARARTHSAVAAEHHRHGLDRPRSRVHEAERSAEPKPRHLVALHAGANDPVPVVRTDGSDFSGQISPDGEWLAYASSHGGAGPQVYVQRFPEDTNRILVSESGGLQPRWRGDGRELFFLTPEGASHGRERGARSPISATERRDGSSRPESIRIPSR